MNYFDKVKGEWRNWLRTVRNKRSLYTSIGLILVIGLAFAFEYSFFVVSAIQRATIGIALQIIAGFILISDQIVVNLKGDKEFKDILTWLTQKRTRIYMMICLFLFLVVVLVWLGMSLEIEVNLWEMLGSIVGMIFWLLIVYNVYLYGIQGVSCLLERWSQNRRKAGPESNIIWGNATLLVLSLPIVALTGLFVRLEQGQMLVQQIIIGLWFVAFAFIVLPVFLLSIVFFMVVGVFQLFVLIRQRVNRVVFWLVLFVLWLWGGLLLLVNVWDVYV